MLTHSVQVFGYGTHKELNSNGMFQNRKARIKQTPLVELCEPDDRDWKNDSPVDGFFVAASYSKESSGRQSIREGLI